MPGSGSGSSETHRSAGRAQQTPGAVQERYDTGRAGQTPGPRQDRAARYYRDTGSYRHTSYYHDTGYYRETGYYAEQHRRPPRVMPAPPRPREMATSRGPSGYRGGPAGTGAPPPGSVPTGRQARLLQEAQMQGKIRVWKAVGRRPESFAPARPFRPPHLHHRTGNPPPVPGPLYASPDPDEPPAPYTPPSVPPDVPPSVPPDSYPTAISDGRRRRWRQAGRRAGGADRRARNLHIVIHGVRHCTQDSSATN